MKIRENLYIRDAMCDEISRNLYINRVAYSNGDCSAIEPIMLSIKSGRRVIDFMDTHREKLYVFGGGLWGRNFVNTWKWKYHFKAIFDNNSALQNRGDIPILPFSKDTFSQDAAIIIMCKLHETEILEQLKEAGVALDHIFAMGKFQEELRKEQYFDLVNMHLSQKECFVDCGVLDGQTSLNFLARCSKRAKKIWMFEPDENNVKKIERAFLNEMVDYKIVQKGVWSCETKLRFDSSGDGCASIQTDGSEIIDTVKLDDILADESPTFIKMDIEGAELEALRGAEQIIKSCRPKLAVCVYHRPEDINDLPEIILKYNPKYKLYLRHYSLLSAAETVLYAVDEESSN